MNNYYQSLMTGPSSPLGTLAVLSLEIRTNIYQLYFDQPITTITFRSTDLDDDEIKEREIRGDRFGGLSGTSWAVYEECLDYKLASRLELNLLVDPYEYTPEIAYDLSDFIRDRIKHIVIDQVVDDIKDVDCSQFPELESVRVEATFSEDDHPRIYRWDAYVTGTGATVTQMNRDIREEVYYHGYKLPLVNYKDDLQITAMAYRVEAEREKEVDEAAGLTSPEQYWRSDDEEDSGEE